MKIFISLSLVAVLLLGLFVFGGDIRMGIEEHLQPEEDTKPKSELVLPTRPDYDAHCSVCDDSRKCTACDGSTVCSDCSGEPVSTCLPCLGDGVCPICDGTGGSYQGGKYKSWVKCTFCDGEGNCGRCRGSGKQRCAFCSGSGACTFCNATGKCSHCRNTQPMPGSLGQLNLPE